MALVTDVVLQSKLKVCATKRRRVSMASTTSVSVRIPDELKAAVRAKLGISDCTNNSDMVKLALAHVVGISASDVATYRGARPRPIEALRS